MKIPNGKQKTAFDKHKLVQQLGCLQLCNPAMLCNLPCFQYQMNTDDPSNQSFNLWVGGGGRWVAPFRDVKKSTLC